MKKNKSGKIINRKFNIYDIIYFLFFIFLPFVYSSELIDPVLIPRQVYLTCFLFILGFILYSRIYLNKQKLNFSFLKLFLPLIFLAFILFVLLSFLQSTVISESLYVFSKLVTELLFYLITALLLINKKLNLNNLFKSIIIFSIIVVTIAIYQMIIAIFSDQAFSLNIQSINSTITNKNLLSSLLFLTIPFSINFLNFNKLWKVISTILFLIILFMLWLIQTKAVVAAFLVFFLLMLCFILKYRKNNTKKLLTRTIIISFFSIIIFASILTIQNKQSFSHLFNKNSAYSRFLIWENSKQMIEENTLFGVGAGNWKIEFPKYGLDKHSVKVKNGLTVYQRPHNDFIWVFSEIGIMGILLYLLIFFAVLYYLFRIIKESKEWVEKWKFATFFAGILGYMLIASVDFPIERVEHQILLLLIFSIVTAKYYSNNEIKNGSKILVRLPYLLLIIILTVLLSFIVSLNRYKGEYHTHKLYTAHHNSDWKKMIREANNAVNLFYKLDPMSIPIEWYKGVALFSLGNINDAKASFEKAYDLNPYNIHVLNNLAACFEIIGDHKKAEELYLNTLSISSEFEEAILNLSAVYFNTKEYDKAFNMIDKCNVHSTDKKYQIFLPAILSSKIDVILNKQTDNATISRLIDIKNSKDKTLNLYFESKKKNSTFEYSILKN